AAAQGFEARCRAAASSRTPRVRACDCGRSRAHLLDRARCAFVCGLPDWTLGIRARTRGDRIAARVCGRTAARQRRGLLAIWAREPQPPSYGQPGTDHRVRNGTDGAAAPRARPHGPAE